jgi:hypothetical protein
VREVFFPDKDRAEMRKLEGTPITEFVDGGKLKSADILLEHSRGSLWGWLIRFGTGNYWNHALMVCSVSGSGEDSDKTLVIDPRMGGIYTINISEYFEKFKSYDVAVKRLDKDWFQDDSKAGGLSFRQMMSDFALRRIEDKSTVTNSLSSAGRTLRRLSIIYRFISRKRKFPKRRKITRTTKPLNLNTYACSGVVQWSYYRGVARIIAEDGLAECRLQEVIFSPWLVGEISDSDLLSITPADLAKSDKLSWKYVIKGGVVWEVSNGEEVNSIIESGKSVSFS